MPAYLITGPNGAGKSTVGRTLAARGYTVIETDFAAGLAGWTNTTTGMLAAELPPHPFPQDWLDKHRWLWQRPIIETLIREHPGRALFFVGGAYNQNEMYDLFAQWFALYTDRLTMAQRLQARGEGRRWDTGSPELERALAWSEKSKDISIAQGGIVVNSSQTPDAIADEILAAIRKNTPEGQ